MWGGGSRRRPRVSMQEVIERDRLAPECHTWALGGQRRTGVGRTQPFTAQAFTTERNHLPGPAHTLPPLCCVKTLLCENCARQVLILRCVRAVHAHMCIYGVDGTAGSRRRSAIVNRNTDLRVCL